MYRYFEYNIHTNTKFLEQTYTEKELYTSDYFVGLMKENYNMASGLENGCMIEGQIKNLEHIHFKLWKEA